MPQKFITEKLIRSSWLIIQLEIFKNRSLFGSFLWTKISKIKIPSLLKNFGSEDSFALMYFYLLSSWLYL